MSACINKSEILLRLHQLPVIPIVIQEVLAGFSHAEVNRNTIATNIEKDQGLSAKVLRVANSSFYGLPRSVHSIKDAVTVMGFNSVSSLVLSAVFMRAFPHPGKSAFNRKMHWRRSFRVAAYARALARVFNMDQHLAFTAGMFHDIGLLVLDVCIPEEFSEMLTQQEQTGASLLAIEQAEIGCDHAEIGAEMARRWNFPPEIEQAILNWRTPEGGTFLPLAGVIYVAVLLEGGLEDEALMAAIPPAMASKMGISWLRIQADLPQSAQLDNEVQLILSAAG